MPPPGLSESRLRHPAERPVFVFTVLLNVALVASAVALVRLGGDWMAHYPRVARAAESAQAAGVALILAPFALTMLRNRRLAAIRANAVRLTRTQIPGIHDDYESMCATLGVQNPPELYVADDEIDQPSAAYSAHGTHFIVLDTRFLQKDLAEVRPVIHFLLARELGRIRLGHTHWLDEMLLGYLNRIPVLRNPLLHTRTYSHDRYAAWLAPDAVRGLVVLASGRHMLAHVDVEQFLRQARAVRGRLPRVVSLTR